MAQLREIYPSDICVTLNYGKGFIALQPSWEQEGKYAAPCGVTGVGSYDIISKTETITIGERTYSATGWELHERDSGAFHREFFIAHLEDGMRVDLGGSGDTYQDYLRTKETLFQILETYRSTRSTISTPSERGTMLPPTSTLAEFPLETGDSWTYEVDLDYEEGGKINEYHLVQTWQVVQSTFEDSLRMSKIVVDNKTILQDSDTIWYVIDDLTVYSASGSGQMQRLMTQLKGTETGYHFDPAFVFPLAVGSRWGDPGMAKSGYQWEVEAQEAVDVPAGHFAECYRLVYVANTGYTRRWVCSGVGVVAWETHHNGTVIDEKAKLIDFDVH